MYLRSLITTLGIGAALAGSPTHAQDSTDAPAREPFRTRVTLGPQLLPSHPGSDSLSLSPFIDFARARGDNEFEFEAADESPGLTLVRTSG